ncbi:MAG TPA: RNA 2',3'-cyclic phosphodiesterase [Candidatus Eisenbacteria bacterium]|nr:RNA 2',3'-cyclic phosphodiesterase [Candidatus Eisenbacteria bacterium]
MTRTFVALLLPPAWIEYLGAVTERLREGTSGMSWVKSGNIHVTVRFLGDLGDSGVKRASDGILRTAASLEAPVARLGGLGAFPSLTRPRVLWMGLSEGEEAVRAAGNALVDGLRLAGFGPPEKPFRPHMTLARVREGARGLDAIRTATLPAPPPAEPLDRIAVMKSELHPAGSRYTALTEVRLRPPGGTAPTPSRPGSNSES